MKSLVFLFVVLNSLVMAACGRSSFSPAGPSSTEDVQLRLGGSQALGVLKSLYLIINFQDDADAPSRAVVDAAVRLDAKSVRNFYLDSSYGKVDFETHVVGPVTIPASGLGVCNPDLWTTMAKEMILKTGIDPESFDLRANIITVDKTTCHFVGGWASGRDADILGTLGWGSVDYSYTLAHEQGHELGFGHAKSLTCPNLDFSARENCQFDEYGDTNDVMGSGFSATTPMLRKAAGWLTDQEVLTMREPGSYEVTLRPIEEFSSAIKMVLIQPPGSADVYTVSFRSPLGPIDSRYAEPSGALIHLAVNGELRQPTLLNLNPGMTRFDVQDHQTVDYAGIPFVLEQVSHDERNLRVKILLK